MIVSLLKAETEAGFIIFTYFFSFHFLAVGSLKHHRFLPNFRKPKSCRSTDFLHQFEFL